MSLLVAQEVVLSILADGTSTVIVVPTRDLLQGQAQIHSNPSSVDQSPFTSNPPVSLSLNGTGSDLTMTFSPAPSAGYITVRFNLLFSGNQMSVLISIWRGGHNVMTASATDAELVSDLKLLAQSKGYRVEVKEGPAKPETPKKAEA